jgi:hypothetical protein
VKQQQSTIKQHTCRRAEEITGTIQLNDRIQWFNQEWSDATETRNTFRIIMLQRKTRVSIEEYRIARRNANQICRRKRESFKKTCCMNWKILLDEMKVEFFEGFSNFKMGFQPRNNLWKERNWNLFAGGQQVLNVLTQYFKAKLNKIL